MAAAALFFGRFFGGAHWRGPIASLDPKHRRQVALGRFALCRLILAVAVLVASFFVTVGALLCALALRLSLLVPRGVRICRIGRDVLALPQPVSEAPLLASGRAVLALRHDLGAPVELSL
jgi:hypothetical protein